MSKRKHTLLAEKVLALREELHPELNLEPCDDVAEINIPQEILNSPAIDKLNSEEQDRLQDLSKRHEEQSKKQKKAHALEISEKEEELEEDLEMDVEKEIESRKEKLEQNYRFKQQQLEEQRRNVRDQLLFVSRDKEVAQKLHEEIQKKDEELRELLENEKKENDSLLDERINRRKIAKQRKLLGFKNSQLNKSIELKLKQFKEQHEVQGKFETQKIKEIVNAILKGKQEGENSQNLEAFKVFEQLWNEKEGKELANLFGRHLSEKETRLRAIYKKNMEQRLMEKQAVKDKYKLLYEDLDLHRAEHDPEHYSVRQKELRVEEANDLKEADIKELMLYKKEQFAILQEMEEKCANELAELQDKLSHDKIGIVRDIFGGYREEEQKISNRIKDLKDIIDREKDRRIKDIEIDKKIMLDHAEQQLKERFNSYEEVLKKQRESEKMIREKKGNIQKMLEERKRQMSELKEKAQFSPEKEKELQLSTTRS